MSSLEFETSFDVLYNNITSNQAPGLNPFEKSIFLTKALDEIVKNYFSPKNNIKTEGLDDNAKRQMDFSMLITMANPTVTTETVKMDSRAISYLWPTDVLFMINETFNVGTNEVIKPRLVIPLSFLDYTTLMSKPYKAPLKYQAWRLVTGLEANQNDKLQTRVEIILNGADKSSLNALNQATLGENKYSIRYIRKPRPIVLFDLNSDWGDPLSIEGVYGNTILLKIVVTKGSLSTELSTPDDEHSVTAYTITIDNNNGKKSVIYQQSDDTYDSDNPCELHESLHWEILQRAVELAKAAWSTNSELIALTNLIAELGKRSE